MQTPRNLDIDVAIFGGGAAGLWTLDVLSRAGARVLLLEAGDLGAGQTIAAQGIIHGGLKYTLDGNVGDSARAIAAMPLLWRDCLAAARTPHLSHTTLRADWCALWRTSDLRSQFGMAGARAALQVRPIQLARNERPAALIDCPGDVYRLDEPVIDPASLLADLAARHRDRILQVRFPDGVDFSAAGGEVNSITLTDREGGSTLVLRPRAVVFTAGEGNGALRERVGLAAGAMQLRPLHMVIVRGDLPPLNGHCTDGAKTRVTITTAVDSAGRNVWQVGGQVAEDGVAMDGAALVAHAQREISAVIPGFRAAGTEWLTHRVNRAEASAGGTRPSDVHCRREGNVVTAWPTKLALVPRLAEQVAELVTSTGDGDQWQPEAIAQWPRPRVARPAWEQEGSWIRDH